MRKFVGLFCLGLLVTVGSYCDSVKSKSDDHVELSIGLAPAFFAGPMVNNVENLLTPTPSGLSGASLIIGASFFPISIAGVELWGHFGTIQATASGAKPLNIFDQGCLLVGPVIRGVFKVSEVSAVNISMSGGLQLTGLGWDTDFTSLVSSSLPGFTLAGVTTQSSYYGRFGVEYLDSGVFGSISLVYEKLAVTLSNGNDLSADSWSVPIQVGLAF